jgi:hypothetical protein
MITRDSKWLLFGACAALVMYLQSDGRPPTEWAYTDWIKFLSAIFAYIMGQLGTSPLKGDPKPDCVDPKKLSKLVVVLALLPLMSACGKNLNFQTNPVGTTAHYATQVTRAAQGVQDAVITAHAGNLMSKDAAAAVVKVTVQIGVKAQELATALAELDKLGLDDLGRKPIVAKVALILQTTNELVYQLNLADYFATLSQGSKEKIRDLLQEISRVLLLVAQGVR